MGFNPTMFRNTRWVQWVDGKPRCRKHRTCLVKVTAVDGFDRIVGPGFTHGCPECERERMNAAARPTGSD
jgi:hypothetical protein